MTQHELGIIFVSLKQLQGSTKILGNICGNPLVAIPNTI